MRRAQDNPSCPEYRNIMCRFLSMNALLKSSDHILCEIQYTVALLSRRDNQRGVIFTRDSSAIRCTRRVVSTKSQSRIETERPNLLRLDLINCSSLMSYYGVLIITRTTGKRFRYFLR